jgi:mitogen-activated protein kinase kinase
VSFRRLPTPETRASERTCLRALASSAAMAEFKTKSLKHKNVKGLGLALNSPSKNPAPSAGDAQIPGGLGNRRATADTLEIGVEFQLDLKTDELVVLRELGAGNGGTVSKVMHPATEVVMARKV